MVTETKRSRYEGGEDDIPLGQPSVQSSFEAGSETLGNTNTTSSASVASSSDNSVEVIEFPAFLDYTAGNPIKSRSNPYRCGGCGNHVRLCPEAMFGVFLTQEMMSVYKRQHGDVTDPVLETMYQDTFNLLLCKFCNDKFTKYDEKFHHNMPQCMVDGSFSYSKALVESMRVIDIIKRKREYNVSSKHISFRNDDTDTD